MMVRQRIDCAICGIACIATLFALGFAAFRLSRTADLGSGVSFDVAAIDLGDLAQGESVTREFTLRNRLNVPITIAAIETSCSCSTLPEKIRDIVAPNDQITIPVTMHAGGHDGRLSAKVSVYYRIGSEPLRHVADAVLSAQVLPDFRLEPKLLDFGTVTELDSVRRSVEIRPAGLLDAKVLDASSSHESFRIRADRISSSRLFVQFNPPSELQSQHLTSVITIKTNSKRLPVAKLFARANFRSTLEVTPTSLVFSRAQGM